MLVLQFHEFESEQSVLTSFDNCLLSSPQYVGKANLKTIICRPNLPRSRSANGEPHGGGRALDPISHLPRGGSLIRVAACCWDNGREVEPDQAKSGGP
jgi:hypothetical protein